LQHHHRVGAAQRKHLGTESLAVSSHRRLGRLDQQLAVETADGEPQKVKAVVEVDDTRLVLVEDQPSGRQPFSEPGLDLLGLFLTAAQGDQIVGVPDQNRCARHVSPA